MGYEKKLAKSFSQIEPQKLTFGLLILCFMVLITFAFISKPYGTLLSARIVNTMLGGKTFNISKRNGEMIQENSTSATANYLDDPPPYPAKLFNMTHDFNLANSTGVWSNYVAVDFLTKHEEGPKEEEVIIKPKPMCDLSNNISDFCDLEGDIRIVGKHSSVILVSKLQRNESWTIQPYARKSDKTAMSSVAKFSIRSSDPDEAPLCTRTHTAPAVVFSGAGYTGNFFHDFSDVLLPLWRASRRFNGEVQFLVVDFRSWWIRKYLPIFSHLSRYKPIEFDGHSSVLCFPRVLVGLRRSGELKADGDSMVGFAEFLRMAYSLPRSSPVVGKKPRLLILARSRTRKFVNMEKMLMTAKKVGFEVVVAEAEADVARFARVVNSCDVMVGVHGAGLTNLVFLPTSGVVIQVVPWGRLDFISRVYFKEPAMAMKLRYLEYDIREEESTLMDIYGRDDVAFRDPYSIHKLGWGQLKKIFLEQQDVRVNVRRFRAVLIKALKLLRENAEG